MGTQWETVRIFISSTFDDMHAERDYLVKQVFPELREWCEKRKLRLVDIDLRWGVKEEDTQNKNVVEVCLRRIDEARPFFLCFLGQRRGWVPRKEDISPSTLESNAFPDLKDSVGNASVTEMEILHALVNPFHRSRTMKAQPSEYYEPVKYALFYSRDPSYLEQLPRDFPSLRKVYTNEGIQDEGERTDADRELERWVREEIPALCAKHGRPNRDYTAKWNPGATSPELLLPLACPSLVPDNVTRWQRKWADEGIELAGTSVDTLDQTKAEEYNHRRTRGRLTGFECEGKPLSRIIIEDLQAAITARYPDHVETGEVGDLQKELDQQEQFLYTGSEGLIERGGDFDDLDDYVKGDSNKLFVLTAPAGMGKSSLLAKWVDRYRSQIERQGNYSIHFRFIGQSDRSKTAYSLLRLLLQEIKEVAGKFDDEIPDDPQKLFQELPKLLEAAGKRGKTVMVLDALNQLESGLSDLSWLPYDLPENIKLIVSFKRGEPSADSLLVRMKEKGQVKCSEVKPFQSPKHRLRLIRAYLKQYLKELDKKHWKALIQLPGAENPLYLKVVLSELRVFGALANLSEKIRSDFGETPVSAFNAVLNRLENDPAYSSIDPKDSVPVLFGVLAHARHGLSVEELSEIFVQVLKTNKEAAADTIHLYLRQVRPFLAHRDGRYDFFFESFKSAVLGRYAGKEEGLLKRTDQDWHRLLADYFTGQPLYLEGGIVSRHNLRKLSEQPYQQTQAEDWDSLQDSLLEFDFVMAKCNAGQVRDLLEDFYRAEMACNNLSMRLKDWSEWKEFLHGQAHIIERYHARYPQLFYQQAYNSSRYGAVARAAQAASGPYSYWFERVNRPEYPPRHAVRFILAGHDHPVMRVLAAPGGMQAVSTSLDGSLCAWDLRSGNNLWKVIGHDPGITCLQVSADGLIASGGRDHLGRVWDLASGTCLATFEGHTAPLTAILPIDSGQIVSADSGGMICLWDTTSGRELRRLSGHAAAVTCLVSLPGNRLASASDDASIRVWDLSDGRCLAALYHHRERVLHLTVVPGEHLLSASQDRTIRLWNLQSGHCIRTYLGHHASVLGTLLLEQRRFLSWSFDGSLRIWSMDGDTCLQTLSGHQEAVTAAMTVGPYGLSASQDRTLRVWDLARGVEISAVRGHEGWVNDLTLAAGDLVITASQDKILRVWDLPALIAPTPLAERADNASITGNVDVIRWVCILDRKTGVVFTKTDLAEAEYQYYLWDLYTGQPIQSDGRLLKKIMGKVGDQICGTPFYGSRPVMDASTTSFNTDLKPSINAVAEQHKENILGVGCIRMLWCEDGRYYAEKNELAFYPIQYLTRWAFVYDFDHTLAVDGDKQVHVLWLHHGGQQTPHEVLAPKGKEERKGLFACLFHSER